MVVTHTRFRWMAAVAGLGFVWFLATAVAVQLARPHAWAAVPISGYLHGPDSTWLQAAYYILAGALDLLALEVLGLPRGRRRSFGVGLLLLVSCAVALAAYSYSPWPLPGQPGLRGRIEIHLVSAGVAFAGMTVFMYLATPLLWPDRWRRGAYFIAGAALTLEILASYTGQFNRYAQFASGAIEKLAIAAIVLWLLACAVRLMAPHRDNDRHLTPGPGRPAEAPARHRESGA